MNLRYKDSGVFFKEKISNQFYDVTKHDFSKDPIDQRMFTRNTLRMVEAVPALVFSKGTINLCGLVDIAHD